jgi:DNA-binding transcriptional LysR family regulator
MWRRVRYFLAVAETLHFGRAARSLGISAQPLGRAIKELEDEVGTPLLIRTTRSVSLTPAGEQLRTLGTDAFAQMERALNAARLTGREQAKVLRIGYSTAFSTFPSELISRFNARAPSWTPTLILRKSNELEDALLHGEVDAALLINPVRDLSLKHVPVSNLEIMVAIPKHHRLRKHRVVSIHALAKEAIVLCPTRQRPGLVQFLRSLLSKHGVTLRIAHEAEDEIRAVRMVAEGLGVTFVSTSAHPEVCVRPLEGRPALSLSLAWRSDERRAILRVLVDAARLA